MIDGDSNWDMMYWTDRFKIFFTMVAREFDFDITSMDTYESIKGVTKNVDFIFGFAWEQRYSKAMEAAITLDKRKTLILYMHDIHWAYELRKEGTTRLLQRADLILVPYYGYFKRMWPQFAKKTILFPHFFAPRDRYSRFKYNKNPKMKCLLTGNIKPDRYPIRQVVTEAVMNDGELKDLVDILRHPRHAKTQYWTREDGGGVKEYPKTINEYFCAVTDSSMWNLLLTKYFEIPASGALLLADKPEDGKYVGLIPWKHYVPVTEENVVPQIKHCLENPEKYEKIRREGMEFVRKYHSVDNRFIQFGKILESVL